MRAPSRLQIVDVEDERGMLAEHALGLIERTFDVRDRHRTEDLRSELAEKRLGLIAPFNLHMVAACEADTVVGTVMGTYLAGVNAGFVHYIAVAESHRRRGTGRLLRRSLVARCRADAVRAGHTDLAWMLGEVRRTSPWLRRLVRRGGAIPFDFVYYHPGLRPGPTPSPYVLYRQPVADARATLPADLVRRIIYAVFHRAYRVRYPLQHEGFLAMLEALTTGGPDVARHPAP